MKNNIPYPILFTALLTLFFSSCIEEFDFQTETFESALVIEATITNELKTQGIQLTRTFRFEEDGPAAESNADVRVIDDASNTFTFSETSPGNYESNTAFSAEPNVNYELIIVTSSGKTYRSQVTQLTNVTTLDSVIPTRTTNSDGAEGMEFTVNSFDPTGNSTYYRYTYDETYKIIAPKWSPLDAIVIDEATFVVGTAAKTEEERVCFGNNQSNTIIITDTNGLVEDRVSNFPVRFISSDNYIISHRYSILVKQFVQSLQAHTFYRTLRDLSGSESLFSQNQPGFFSGNVYAEANENEKVLGFFEVSSVSSQRIFFNYNDFYPLEPLPPYVISCVEFSPALTTPGQPPTSPLIDQINAGTVKYFADNDSPGQGEGPFFMVTRACGDCTVLGSNIVPAFWVD
jgi:hypothetical protein